MGLSASFQFDKHPRAEVPLTNPQTLKPSAPLKSPYPLKTPSTLERMDSYEDDFLDEYPEGFLNEEHLEYLNETELYFEQFGPPDAPAIIYLHGGPGYNSYSFRSLVGEDLTRYRMVYPDQRGAGRSAPLAGDLSVDTLVDDLEAIREFLELDSFTPLGHGFGAVIALEYARRFPGRVPRVIAVNPWLHMPELALTLLREASTMSGKEFADPRDELPEPREGEYPRVGNARVERAFSLLGARDLLNALEFPEIRGRLRLEFADVESQLLGGGEVQESLVSQGFWEFEYPPYLLEQTRPVFVIAGTQDRTSYPAQVDWLLDLAGADVQELETGHYPWVDEPEAFVEALERVMEG